MRLTHPGSYRRGMSDELTDTVPRRPCLSRPVAEPWPGTTGAAETGDLRVSFHAGSPPVIEVRGEIDVCSSPQLRDQLLWVIHRHGARLTLDLGGVTFMDCAGIGALLATRRRAQFNGGWLRIGRASPRVQRILALASVRQILMPALPHWPVRPFPQFRQEPRQ